MARTRFQVYVGNHQYSVYRLDLREVIVTHACDHIRGHYVFKQKRCPNENLRASSVDLIVDKCSHHVGKKCKV